MPSGGGSVPFVHPLKYAPGYEMSVTEWLQYRAADFYDKGIQKLVLWYDKSILEVIMLKNSSTLAVSAPINLSIKLGFVSVNSPRETYFVDMFCSSVDCFMLVSLR